MTSITVHGNVDQGLLRKVKTWVGDFVEKGGTVISPDLSIDIWKSIQEYRAFYNEETKSLGVITGEEEEFLATHEAWRGYPRIHLCEERLMGIPDEVIEGAIHHEIGHAVLHGRAEFYTFRFSRTLQEEALLAGMEYPLLQQCIYFLSLAIKDMDVILWLSRKGLGPGQMALIYYLLKDTEDERIAWEMARSFSGLRKLALSSFLKILLPIEAIVSEGSIQANDLENRWKDAYRWLSEGEREALLHLSRDILKVRGGLFQDRLEDAALRLIKDPSL